MNYLVQVQDEQSSWNVVDVHSGDAGSVRDEGSIDRPVRFVGGRRAATTQGKGTPQLIQIGGVEERDLSFQVS